MRHEEHKHKHKVGLYLPARARRARRASSADRTRTCSRRARCAPRGPRQSAPSASISLDIDTDTDIETESAGPGQLPTHTHHYVRRTQVIVEQRRLLQLERVQVRHAAAHVQSPAERAIGRVEQLTVGEQRGALAMQNVEQRAEAHALRHHRQRWPLIHDGEHWQHVRVIQDAQAPARNNTVLACIRIASNQHLYCVFTMLQFTNITTEYTSTIE